VWAAVVGGRLVVGVGCGSVLGFSGGCGNGSRRWWLVVVSWVLQWVSQWVLVDFDRFCSEFRWAMTVGWVSDGGGSLSFLMVAVTISGSFGVFIWEKRDTLRKREEEMQRIKKELKKNKESIF